MDQLYVKQLAKPIEEKGVKPNDYVQDWTELDRRCLGYIRVYIDIGVIYHVENETTVIGCWTKLQGPYERKTTGHKVSLMRQLSMLRYQDGQSITEHLNQLEHIFNQLTTMGVDFNDEVQALWILVPQLLMEQFQRRWCPIPSSMKNCVEGEASKLVMEDIKATCWHMYTRRDLANGMVKNKKVDNNVTIVNPVGDLIVIDSSDVFFTPIGEDWVIDSGASFHVTPHKSLFSKFKEGNYGEARIGNNGVSKIMAIGDVHVKTNCGRTINLKDVRYIPDFMMNLVSSGQLDDQGYLSVFGGGE
ncbi:hypothetical protein LIER_12995 [Lithospermum erythrorhizon]|uniref:Retrovirus-related Pol polyprotein from transposon TNT 1-94-like beta-barrel domain-containing protein n=1 Tax=Lithospermum erythrorhizon TaxID=34254 RepID=A0AAV3PU09_LITER